MRTPSKRILAGLILIPLLGPGLGCGSSEVEREDLPPIPMPAAVPVSELPKDQQPGEGSSAGMTSDPTRGLTQ